MPVEIKFIGENGQQAAMEIGNFLHQMTLLTNPNLAAMVAAQTLVKTETETVKEEPVKEEKPKKAKAKKEEEKIDPLPPGPTDDVKSAPAADEVAETLEGCQSIVRTVMETDGTKDGSKGGLKLAHAVIVKFGVARVRDLPADKYKDFISECNKLLVEKKAAPAADIFA